MQQVGNKQRIINLGDLIEGLSEAGIEFIIVGGLAAVIQGAPVTTMDLDIVHHQKEDNIRKLLNFLKQIDAYYRRPDDKIIEPDEQDLAAKGLMRLSTNMGPLDVLAFIQKTFFAYLFWKKHCAGRNSNRFLKNRDEKKSKLAIT